MRTLFDDWFAPITSRIGFLDYPLQDTIELLAAWYRGLGRNVDIMDLTGRGLSDALSELEPLNAGTPRRQILIDAGGWTAYFDSGLVGSDPVSTVGHLAEVAQRKALLITTVPDAGRRQGSVQWQLLADHPTDFLNYQRSVWVANDDGRWIFGTRGEPLPFEAVDRYRARKVRDRFDSHLLERYSQALGVDPFNPDSYGPRVALLTSDHPSWKRVPESRTLLEVQAELGIQPGRSGSFPG